MYTERERENRRGLDYMEYIQTRNIEQIRSPIPPNQFLEFIVYGEFRFKYIYKEEFEKILTTIINEKKPHHSYMFYVTHRFYKNKLEFIAFYNVVKCMELITPILSNEHKAKPIRPEDIMSMCSPHQFKKERIFTQDRGVQTPKPRIRGQECFRPKKDGSDKHTEYIRSKKYPYSHKVYQTCKEFSFQNTYQEDFKNAMIEILQRSQYRPALFLLVILDKDYVTKDEFFLYQQAEVCLLEIISDILKNPHPDQIMEPDGLESLYTEFFDRLNPDQFKGVRFIPDESEKIEMREQQKKSYYKKKQMKDTGITTTQPIEEEKDFIKPKRGYDILPRYGREWDVEYVYSSEYPYKRVKIYKIKDFSFCYTYREDFENAILEILRADFGLSNPMNHVFSKMYRSQKEAYLFEQAAKCIIEAREKIKPEWIIRKDCVEREILEQLNEDQFRKVD